MSSTTRMGLALAACATLLAACGGTVDLDPTSQQVTRTERVWIDASRKTPRTANYAGAPERMLRAVIWHPSARDAAPLLLMAHGFGGLPEKFDAFARTVAAAGFIVAAPAFPLTNQEAPGGHEVGFRDFVSQPGDLGFVLTQLLEAARTPGDPLAARIAGAQVAVLGHSLGGATVVGLTRKQCCVDARVRASILVAAAVPLAAAFGADASGDASLPTLIIHGTADHSVAYATAPAFYERISPPRFLLGLSGAGHSEALESQLDPPIPARDAAQRITIAFLSAVFRVAAAELHATFASLGAAGNVVQMDGGVL